MLRLRLDQDDEPPAWFQRTPFAGKLVIALYAFALYPVGYSIFLAVRGEWLLSAAYGTLWLLAFPFVATYFHRRRLVHIRVSIFAASAALVAYPLTVLTFE